MSPIDLRIIIQLEVMLKVHIPFSFRKPVIMIFFSFLLTSIMNIEKWSTSAIKYLKKRNPLQLLFDSDIENQTERFLKAVDLTILIHNINYICSIYFVDIRTNIKDGNLIHRF